MNTKLTRLVLTAVGIAVLGACTDTPTRPAQPTAGAPVGQRVLRDVGGLVPTLLACAPATYDSVSRAIGPAGGTLTVGPHTFEVPAGALDSTVTITAVVAPDQFVHVRFAPQGLTFAVPANLTLSYANCPLAGLLGLPAVAYVDDSLSILELEPSLPDLLHSTVTGHIRHFSGYAVAY